MILVSVIPAIIVGGVLISGYESEAVSGRISIVKNQSSMLCDQLALMNYMEDPTDAVINGKIEMLTAVYGGRILIIDTDFRVIKDTYAIDDGKFILSPVAANCFNGEETENYNKDGQYVEMTKQITDPANSSKITGVMLISFSTKEYANTKLKLVLKMVLILALIVALAIFVVYYVSGYLVRPFTKIAKAVDSRAMTFSNDPIYITEYMETELISEAFNRLLRQVSNMDESRQEFVSNVSHELKTPLASIKVLADSLNTNPEATLEQYREFMVDISEEIDRENAIISDLLSMVVLDKKAGELNIAEVNVNKLIYEVIKRLSSITKLHHVDLVFDAFKEVIAQVDEMKMSLAVTNVIENAIKYNKDEGGWVRVSLNADRKYFYFSVSDSGIGIPEDAIDHIFDRFYRADKSHSKEISGTGLGLAITKSIIVMHKGAIKVESKEMKGTVISIRIPLLYTK